MVFFEHPHRHHDRRLPYNLKTEAAACLTAILQRSFTVGRFSPVTLPSSSESQTL